MSRGKHRNQGRTVSPVTRKGVLLSADERAAVRQMKANGVRSATALGRAIGRSAPDVQAYLDSPDYGHD